MKRKPRKRVHCDACNKDFSVKKMRVVFPNIPHLSERLDIGGEVPAGECPECESLVYVVKEGEGERGGKDEKLPKKVVVVLEEGLIKGIVSEIPLEILVKDVDEDAQEKFVYTHWRPEEVTVAKEEVEKTFKRVRRRR